MGAKAELLNLYQYVNAKATSSTDPTGLEPYEECVQNRLRRMSGSGHGGPRLTGPERRHICETQWCKGKPGCPVPPETGGAGNGGNCGDPKTANVGDEWQTSKERALVMAMQKVGMDRTAWDKAGITLLSPKGENCIFVNIEKQEGNQTFYMIQSVCCADTPGCQKLQKCKPVSDDEGKTYKCKCGEFIEQKPGGAPEPQPPDKTHDGDF